MESTINKLFDSKNRRFEIPSYQRAYSWEQKQINQFLEDLRSVENQYYLGHFLFEVKQDDTLYVIDGQQRLTTVIIFFSVFRNLLLKRKANGEEVTVDLDDIQDYYLRDLRKSTQKFKTVAYDNNFFIEEIINSNEKSIQPADTQSKQRIRAAKDIFIKELTKAKTQELEKWARLIENATITKFEVKDKIQSTQVFAFQNDRGKRLTNLEVVKAFFMLQMYLSGETDDKIQEDIQYLESEFADIYKQIVRINLEEDEVLNYYWRSVSGQGFYSEEVTGGIKKEVSKAANVKGDWIKQFISGLAQAFRMVETLEGSKNSHVKELFYLNNMALSFPFLFRADQLQTSASDLGRLVSMLENITFRYLLRGGRAEIEARLNPFLITMKSAVSATTKVDQIIERLKTDPWWSYWNDRSMNEYVNGQIYKNRVDNYLLWKYELHLGNKNHPIPHNISFHDLISNESIEHIAPQTPTDGKPLANGYGVYEDKVNPEEGIVSGSWLHCIGNLMLISQAHNSSIGNKPFPDKLASYGKDNLLNQQKQVVNYVTDPSNPVWDKDAISRRHAAILNAVKEIWDLNKI